MAFPRIAQIMIGIGMTASVSLVSGCDLAQYSPPPDLTFQPIPADLLTPPDMASAPPDLATAPDLSEADSASAPVDGGTND